MNRRPFTHRDLLLPKEHGSWSLAFEPVALGLLVAPSTAGAALAGAVAAGFLTRRPLKLAVTLPGDDLRRGPARRWAAFLAGFAGLALAGTVGIGGPAALWPLLLAAPFGVAFLWFDLHAAMREAEAELAGSIAFAVLPAAFATLAGWPVPAALALAALSLARSLPTVLTVRTCLRLGKGQPTSPIPPLAAAVSALVGIAILAQQALVPPVAVVLVALLGLRTGWLVSALRPDWPARRIGMLEAVLGVIFLGGLVAAYRWF